MDGSPTREVRGSIPLQSTERKDIAVSVPTNPDWRDQLTDLPLIREDFLLQIEHRLREGASPAEIDELRRDYHEVFGRS